MGRARVRLPHALEVAEQRVAAHQVEAELAACTVRWMPRVRKCTNCVSACMAH